MPGKSAESLGNVQYQTMFVVGSSAGVSTPSVNANTSTIQTYAVPGLQVNDLVDVQSQTHVAGLSVGSSWCASPGVVTIQFINSTGSTIAAQTNYVILGMISRLDGAALGLGVFPTSFT